MLMLNALTSGIEAKSERGNASVLDQFTLYPEKDENWSVVCRALLIDLKGCERNRMTSSAYNDNLWA